MSTFPQSSGATVAQNLVASQIKSTFDATGNGTPVDVGAYPRCVASGDIVMEGSLSNVGVQLAVLFPDRLYVELQRHGLPSEEAVEPHLLDLAYSRDLPLVATNEAYFAKREDYEAHDALICIAEGAVIGQDNRRRLTEEHYFKSRAEMAKLFADLPEAVRNSVEIAMRCSFWPAVRKPLLPRFTGAGADATAADEAEAEMLRAEARAGLARRLATHGLASGKTEAEYQERLEYEIGVIVRMKYHQPTRAYVARRITEGKTKPEIMRCLKRHIAREIWTRTKHLRQQTNTHQTTTCHL